LRPYIRGDVVEVGAGIGESTKYICEPSDHRWLCIDPDPRHVSYIASQIASRALPSRCDAKCGVLADLGPEIMVDTVVYVDVLEHIDEDEQEMRIAARHLRPGGYIVVLSPAFNFLFSPFDKAVGHFRRYSKRDVGRLTVDGLRSHRVFFLDSVGFLASLTNRLFLKAKMPSSSQIAFWDKALVPASRIADRLLGALLGKTIVMIWQKL
jgi:SAM-dependent methyltransferase